MSIALDRHYFTVSLVMLEAHALSVWIGVSACAVDGPSRSGTARRGMPLRALWNRSASSASVADTATFCMILLIVCTAPLCGGGVAEGGESQTCL
jgi:hypothetical protein